jgi:hypothetical protein
MIPDPVEKRVVLPVRCRAGAIEFFYGGPLPTLEEGTIGELVVPMFALKNQSLLSALNGPSDVELFPERTTLLAGLRPEREIPLLPEPFRDDKLPLGFHGFAEIVLQQPLVLRLRGTKRAVLKPCICRMPALPQSSAEESYVAESVNHAYTLLSTAFETHRRSHTGNVFQTVFFRVTNALGPPMWQPLEDLRQQYETEFASRVRGLVNGGR